MRWSECYIKDLVLYGIIQYYTTQSAKIPIIQTHRCNPDYCTLIVRILSCKKLSSPKKNLPVIIGCISLSGCICVCVFLPFSFLFFWVYQRFSSYTSSTLHSRLNCSLMFLYYYHKMYTTFSFSE